MQHNYTAARNLDCVLASEEEWNEFWNALVKLVYRLFSWSIKVCLHERDFFKYASYILKFLMTISEM